MLKKLFFNRSNVESHLSVLLLSTALVACGSSNSLPIGEQDADNDTIINSLDPDADGDNILDVDDPFVDLDGDGLDDDTGETEEQALANNPPVDSDNDGFTDVTANTPCGGESGTDNDSSNNTWGDNCTIKRTLSNGQFADSLYSVGIQRVLYCTGFGSGDQYTDFADGEYGPASEAALEGFQRAEGLADDGIVGSQTWTRLQSKVELLASGVADVTPDTLGFTTGPCANIPLFYQQTTSVQGSTDIILGGWELARNQPNSDQRVPFSIGSPFNRL